MRKFLITAALTLASVLPASAETASDMVTKMVPLMDQAKATFDKAKRDVELERAKGGIERLLDQSFDCYREPSVFRLSRIQYCYAFHFVAAERDKDFWERQARGKDGSPMSVDRVAKVAQTMLIMEGFSAEGANMITNMWMFGYYQ